MVPGGAISLLALFAAPGVTAAPAAPDVQQPFRVEFDAPAGCSEARAFSEGVLSRINRAAGARAHDAGVRLIVRLTRSKASVHGELRMIDDRGETETRKVDGTSCAEVVEVLSLTAA